MASRPAEATPAPAATPVTDGAPSFDDAFAAAAAAEASDETGSTDLGEAPPAEAPPAEAPPAEAPPAEAPPAEGAPAAEPAAGAPPVAPTPGEAPPAPPAEPAAPAAPAPSAEDIVKGITEAIAKGVTPPVADAAPAAEAPPAIYSPDEQQTIVDYEKNWPDVAQAEALKRKGEYHDLTAYIFQEVHKFYAPHLQMMAAMGNTLHTQELAGMVQDYTPAVEADVVKWIDTQPAYLQAPMKQVMQTGTSEEVADLIGRYRGATGTTPAAAAPAAPAAAAPAAPATPAKTELSPLAKQAAESLAPVSSDRTQVPAGEDSGDYDSAFSRYAAEEAKSP